VEFEGSIGAWRIFSANGGSSPVIWTTEPAASRMRVEIHCCMSQDTPVRDVCYGAFRHIPKGASVYCTYIRRYKHFACSVVHLKRSLNEIAQVKNSDRRVRC